jgi:hypothetical protein
MNSSFTEKTIYEEFKEIQDLLMEELLTEKEIKENLVNSINTINGLNLTIPLTISKIIL